MATSRCINIDWLEVYCIESPIGFPHNAEAFRRDGWWVVEREYGTPTYAEMFTIWGTDGEPLLEVRRNPKSSTLNTPAGLFDPRACHIRLCNRTCYMTNAVQILMEFLQRYMYELQRITRIDIALDFERFDYGDNPADVIARYMKGVYTKINQANVTSHGTDSWNSRIWNSLSWGKPKSMVRTRFYDKTRELEEAHDKPYIRQAWYLAGLVDDWQNVTKRNEDGQPIPVRIWRVEFAIKSSTRGWFLIEKSDGAKKRLQSIRNTPAMYDNRQKLLNVFMSLADHYFHFKVYKDGVRKDRCPDKLLFRMNDVTEFYDLDKVAASTPRYIEFDRLLAKLITYRDTHPMPDIYKACETLIADLQKQKYLHDLTIPWSDDEITYMRLLLNRRTRNPSEDINEDMQAVRKMVAEHDFFGYTDDTHRGKKAGQ